MSLLSAPYRLSLSLRLIDTVPYEQTGSTPSIGRSHRGISTLYPELPLNTVPKATFITVSWVEVIDRVCSFTLTGVYNFHFQVFGDLRSVFHYHPPWSDIAGDFRSVFHYHPPWSDSWLTSVSVWISSGNESIQSCNLPSWKLRCNGT